MTEILTESFCERCGTRYTFESTARRASPLGALGTVGRGLRNFVASPDASLDEAFAVARAETEQRATAHQLEAFHRTFNFCLSCRQYTCADCWNAVDGRCLSCSPLPEAVAPFEPAPTDRPLAGFASGPADLAWPMLDLHEHAPAEGGESPSPELEPGGLPDLELLESPPEALEIEPEGLGAEVPLPEAEPEPQIAAVAEPMDEAVSEPEIAAGAEPEPEMDEAVSEPGSAAVAGPEPTATEPVPPIAPERRKPILPFAPGASLDDEIAAYDLRMAALSATPPEPAVMTPAPPTIASPPPAPVPLRPAARAVEPAMPVSRPIQMSAPPRAIVPELPPAVAGEGPIGASTGTCPSCGLSLSASAQFCRRCGTQQRV